MASTLELAVPPGTVGFGDPILQADDVEFIHTPILAEAFGRWCELNEDTDQVEAWRKALIDTLKGLDYWVDMILQWVDISAGIQLPPDEALLLYIEVLWHRNFNDDISALQLLQEAQTRFFSIPWPKNSLLVENVDSDSEDEIKRSSEPVTNSIDTKIAAKTFHSRMHKEWLKAFLHDKSEQLSLCKGWRASFQSFFRIDSDQITTSPLKVVLALRQMRAISHNVYKQESWTWAVKDSGLARVLEIICEPETRLELSEPYITASYWNHCWKESLGEVLEMWTPTNFKSVNTSIRDPIPSTKPDLQSIIKALSANNCVVPTASCPTSAFFLVNKRNFEEAWNHWLKASLEQQGFDVLQWSPLEVHCILQGCNIQSFNDKNTGAMHPRLRKLLELTENLQTNKKKTRDFSYHSQSTTIIGSVKHITPTKQFSSSSGKSKVKKKSSHQSFKNEILSPSISHLSPSPSLNSSHNPSRETTPLEKAEDMEVEEYILPVGGCKLCQHLPPKERCCWYIEVEERSTTELEGSVLTCTEDETDRLAPLKMKGYSKKFKYFTPKDLGLLKLEHRPDIEKRCGRDCIVLIDKKTQQIVGGVRFNAFSDYVWGRLKDHHKSVRKFKPLKRGSAFQNWKYGEIKSLGSQMPQGGRPGDAYVPYAGIEGSTEEELEALFEHAFASDMLCIATESIAVEVAKAIHKTDQNTPFLNPLGSAGSNLYVCTDYMAPQHCDNDTGISLCCQINKESKIDEFCFAYTKWGAYIQTQSNTAWVFYSHDLHGTVMPRRSTFLNSNVHIAMSTGNHVTKRKKDATKAASYQKVRENYGNRSQYWRT